MMHSCERWGEESTVSGTALLEFQLYEKRDVRIDPFCWEFIVLDVTYCYSSFKPIHIIRNDFIILSNCLVPGAVLNPGNINLTGSRETLSRGNLIALMFKQDLKQLQKKRKAIIMLVTAFVTRKQLDLKQHKYTHILNWVLFFLLASHLPTQHKQICWHKTASKVNLIWWLVCEAGNSHFMYPIINMSITSITNVRRVGSMGALT